MAASTPLAKRLALLRGAFPGVSEYMLADLAAVVQERSYPVGTELCHEGQAETTFYIVVSGRVEVVKRLEEVSRVLNHHGPGEFFGEIALIQNSRRAASAITTEPTVVLEMDKTAFDAFLSRSPAVGAAIMRQVAARLSEADEASLAELRAVNQELATALRHLEEQQRLRSEFLSTVGHELRTPLTVAKGYLQLLHAGAMPLDRKDAIDTVYRHVDKIVHLVNNILFMQEMAMIDLDFETVSLGDIVSRVVQACQDRARDADVTVRIDCAILPPLVRGDIEGLLIAINAILDNAVKFSPGGEQVIVRLGLTGDGRRATLDVEDHGIGIAPEYHQRIFERFPAGMPGTSRTSGGLGLGLPIAKYIVEKHSGTLAVRSQEGRGATFTITLPVADDRHT